MTVVQGFNTHVNVNNVRKAVRSWRVEDNADDLDSSTTEDGGFGNGATGVRTATITLTFSYEPDEISAVARGSTNVGAGAATAPLNPFSPPCNLFVRSRVPLRIFVENSAAKFYDFPVAEVIGTPIGADSRGLEEETVTLRSRGPYFEPIG
jgi:hypothetical protein